MISIPQTNAVPFDKMEALDQYMLRQTWALARCARLVRGVCFSQNLSPRESLLHGRPERVLFRRAQGSTLHVCAEFAARRSAQTAVWRIGEALVRMLAPIMSFTCEEIWQYLPKCEERVESVHLAQFPDRDQYSR